MRQLYQQLTQHFGAVKMECEPMPLRAVANSLMQQRKRNPAAMNFTILGAILKKDVLSLYPLIVVADALLFLADVAHHAPGSGAGVGDVPGAGVVAGGASS